MIYNVMAKVMLAEEFRILLNELYEEDVYIDVSADGLYVGRTDDDIPTEDLHERLAEKLGVSEVTSIHIDDCEPTAVWIAYKNGEDPNTLMTYQYRDASNWKKMNKIILPGTLTDSQVDEIKECLDSEERFIPRQLGLPEKRFDVLTEDDHCWFELCDFEKTNAEPTVAMSANDLLCAFRSAKGNWDDVTYAI